MKHSLLPIAALLAVSACARVEPIDMNEIEEVEPVAVENAVVAGAPGLVADLAWAIDGQSATLANGETELLSLECADGSLEIARYADGPSGAGTLTFGTSAALASVAVAASGAAEGSQRYSASLAEGDIGDDVVAVFSAGTPVDVTMTGVDPLIAPASAEVGTLVASCIAREAEDADGEAATNAVS